MECQRDGEHPFGVENSKIMVYQESEVRDLNDRLKIFELK